MGATRGKLCLGAVAVCLVLAGSAYANTGTLDLQYVNYEPGYWVKIHLDGEIHATVGTGVYNLRLRPIGDNGYVPTGEGLGFYPGPQGGIINTFCADVHQYVPSKTEWTTYEVNYPADAPIGDSQPLMESSKANDLKKLFADHAGILETTDDLEAAAFELCVWEIIYEREQPSYSVAWDAGSFYAVDPSTVRDQANAWLQRINNGTATEMDERLRILSNECRQDYAITLETGDQPPIPEPLTMVALSLGVGGLAGYVRRRRGMA